MDKCTVVKGKFVKPCARLFEAGETGNPTGKRKGIFAWSYHTPKGPSRTMFGVKSGDHVHKGLLFNFCPFCGKRIDAPFNQAGSTEAATAPQKEGAES